MILAWQQRIYQRKLWLTCWQKESSEHHPIYRYWCLLDSDSSLQPRTLWLGQYRCYHSFSWFAFCTRQVVRCWRHWECCYAIWLLRPFFRSRLRCPHQWMAPFGPRSSRSRWEQHCDLRWICRQYQHWTWLWCSDCSSEKLIILTTTQTEWSFCIQFWKKRDWSLW